VHPVQVNVVGLQSLQTGFHCLHHALAVIARRIRIIAGHSVGVFRGYDHALAITLHELAQEFFARAAGVEIRRVDEVAASLAVGLIDFLRFSLR
jgi:hypothetical protein